MSLQQDLQHHYRRADLLLLKVCWGLFIYSLILAPWYKTWTESLLVGGGTVFAISFIYALSSGSVICRIANAAATMVLTALHIHQAQGMIEMHFGVFALLAILLYYRDPLPIIVAAAVIAVHHVSFYFLQASGAGLWVLKTTDNGFWVILLHAGYVVAESALLLLIAVNWRQQSRQSIEIMYATQQIAGDENIDLRIRTSGNSELLQRFNQFTGTIESLTKEVKNKAGVLSTDGASLSDIVSQMNHANRTQQQETEQIADSVVNMTDAIKSISEHAVNTASATSEVSDNAQEATLVSEETRLGVERLAHNVSEAQSTVQNLNQHTSAIVTVLEVIRGVAEQTNLLALNAAIEAARAGEQGRGFAVVADEVRTLAQRTQQSTEEIDQLIATLQSSSENTVEAISNSREQAEQCVQNTNASLELMQRVSSSISEISEMNKQIASSAEQQSRVLDEMNYSIANIRDTSRDTHQVSEQATRSADKLLQISKDLGELTNIYQTSQSS